MNSFDNITTIKGIGEKTAISFSKLGIRNVGELVANFPRNYLTYSNSIDIKDAEIGTRCTIYGVVSTYVEVRRVRSLQITTFSVKDSTGTIKLTWFNQPYLRNVFKKGESYFFVGTIRIKNGIKVMEVPEYYKPRDYARLLECMQPVYSLVKGLSNKTIQKAVSFCREYIASMFDYISVDIRNEYGLMSINDAYENIHFPVNKDLLIKAINRIAFDEFYRFIYEMNQLKQQNYKQKNTHVITQGKIAEEFIHKLPYKLTKDQLNAIDDILVDMGSEIVMNRLVQGDVGSGKTIVSAVSILACINEGYQCALMVPTEVLAKQHLEEFKKLFSDYDIRIECLVSSLSIKEKRVIYEDIADDKIDLLIGTHAIIQEKVNFKNLGLVVTDEQHRFGVNQRKALIEKGTFPHTLIMSATPIPRTLGIIMYADLDVSIIKQMPAGRKNIKNCVVGTNYRKTSYNFIEKEIENGGQAYVICPMVNESDTLDVTNVIEYTDVLKEALGGGVTIKTLYGQMNAKEKQDIMDSFIDGETKVLVSTTVIEVGINNPNATVIMIENAERFGLAQLHQLRGRVGRGNKQSYAIFIDGKESEESQNRLRVLENSNDGFYIANEDLKMRGVGDFFGNMQHGEVLFGFADIYKHSDMLKTANEIFGKYGESLKPVEDIEIIKETVL